MQKIPTLFKRVYENDKVVGITNEVTPGMEWVLEGFGKATIKMDGSCCAIINGLLYKRYDAKNGKIPPNGSIPCCKPDPITGHHPHWVPVNLNNPSDKWIIAAYKNSLEHEIMYNNMIKMFRVDKRTDYIGLIDGTYEAIGPHFQGNPYGLPIDILERHGTKTIMVERSFDGIKEYLEDNLIEGIVFWRNGFPRCKIKRTDFNLNWSVPTSFNEESDAKNNMAFAVDKPKDCLSCEMYKTIDINGRKYPFCRFKYERGYYVESFFKTPHLESGWISKECPLVNGDKFVFNPDVYKQLTQMEFLLSRVLHPIKQRGRNMRSL